MIRKYFLSVILSILFFVTPAHAKKAKIGPVPEQRVEFTPIIEKARYKSRPKCQITNRTDDDLAIQGYVRIGLAEVELLTRKCVTEKNKEKCEDLPLRADPTTLLLEEGAKKGGDLIVLIENKKEMKTFEEGKVCKAWTQEYGYRYVQNHATGLMELEFGTTQMRCSEYGNFVRSYDTLKSMGHVWRHDPDLAEKVRLGEELMEAVVEGDIKKVGSLLDAGLDVNKTTDTNGRIALSHAAEAGQVEMAKFLLSQGAKVNAFDRLASPLYQAVDTGHLEVVRLFLSNKAKVNAKLPHSEQTAIFAAARNGSVEIMRELLKDKAKVNISDENGITPLMIAAYEGNPEVLRILLESKSDLDRQTDIASDMVGKWTALHFAVLQGDADVVEILLRKGANAQIRDHNGYRPLDLSELLLNLELASNTSKTGKHGKITDMLFGFSEGFSGYVDRSGTLVIAPEFSYAGTFTNGLAVVSYGTGTGRIYGYIDRTGKFKVEPEYRYAEPFFDGVAVVGKGGYAYELFGEVTWAGMEYGFVNASGKRLPGWGYSKARRFSEGLAPVQGGSNWGFVDPSGKLVIKERFEEAWYFTEGVAAVKLDGKYGYIDKKGNFVIDPVFGEAGPFSEGLAWFRESDFYLDKYGFIDRKGNVVIAPKYDYPAYFKGGKALVYGGALGLPSYIDRAGNKVGNWSEKEPVKIAVPYGGEVVSDFSEDLAPVRYKGNAYLDYLFSKRK